MVSPEPEVLLMPVFLPPPMPAPAGGSARAAPPLPNVASRPAAPPQAPSAPVATPPPSPAPTTANPAAKIETTPAGATPMALAMAAGFPPAGWVGFALVPATLFLGAWTYRRLQKNFADML